MVSPLKRLTKIGTAAALTGAFFMPQSMAQDAEQAQPSRRDTFQDWTLTCFTTENGEACNLSQAFVQQDSGRAIMRAIVRRLPGAENAVMILTVPLGVNLRKGASLQITEDKFLNNLTYTMCLQDGCRLQFPLTAEALQLMGASTERGRLIFGRPNQEQNIGVPISFNGFSEAYASFLGTQ